MILAKGRLARSDMKGEGWGIWSEGGGLRNLLGFLLKPGNGKTDGEARRLRSSWAEGSEQPDWTWSRKQSLLWAMWLLIDIDNHSTPACFVFGQEIRNENINCTNWKELQSEKEEERRKKRQERRESSGLTLLFTAALAFWGIWNHPGFPPHRGCSPLTPFPNIFSEGCTPPSNHSSSQKKPQVESEKQDRNFLGGPVARTSCFQGRGPGFDPWSGN